MKVVHVTSVHPVGDVRILYKECVSLSKAEFDVTLLAYAEKDEEYAIQGVRIVTFRKPQGGRIKRMLASSKKLVLRAVAEQADIYHLHDPELLRYTKFFKKNNAKVIFDAHEDLPGQILYKSWIPKLLRPLISKVAARFEKKYISKLDAFVTVNETIRAALLCSGTKGIICTNYARLSEYENVDIHDKATASGFCFVGNITYVRGVYEAIQAAGLSCMRLTLCGKFSTKKEEAHARTLNGWAQTDFKGPTSRDECAIIMNQSLAGIVTYLPMPNHTDAMPNKIFEYMAMGLPIIASDFPAWKKFIEKENTGICVDPTSPRQIADALLRLDIDRPFASELGRNGRKAFLEKYNWEVEEKKLIALYEEMAQDIKQIRKHLHES